MGRIQDTLLRDKTYDVHFQVKLNELRHAFISKKVHTAYLLKQTLTKLHEFQICEIRAEKTVFRLQLSKAF